MDVVKASILVAEDDPVSACITSYNLERAGFSVEIASNGQEALAKADTRRFDVVITDEQMPYVTGQELVRQLRDDEWYSKSPIVFLTGRLFEVDYQQLHDELGVCEVISKPFSPKRLVELMNSITA